VALATNADLGNEESVDRFDIEDLQPDATVALRSLARKLGNGTARDAANRILLISGLAGSGKTHLVLRESKRVPENLLPIVIFSPDRWKEFGPWLDDQIIRGLLRGERLDYIATLLTERAFGTEIGKVRDDLRKDWGENPLRDYVEQLRAAARLLSVQNVNLGAVVDGALPIRTPADRLKKHASLMANRLKLGLVKDGVDFCAALLLYQTPFSQQAVSWLSHKGVPDHLTKWGRTESRFNTFAALSVALKSMNFSMLVYFDQLERVALDISDGDTKALKQLIQESLAILWDHSNVGCVISALQSIAERTRPILSDADWDRIRDDPRPQELDLLQLLDLEVFFRRRLEHVGEVFPTLAAAMSDSIRWLVQNGQLRRVPGAIPPRVLLRCLGEYASRFLSNGPEAPDSVWRELLPSVATAPEPVIEKIDAEEAKFRRAESQFHSIQAEGVLAVLPKSDAQILSLIGWALTAMQSAYPSVSSVTVGSPERGGSELSFETQIADQSPIAARLFLANEPNNGKLTKQLESIASKRIKSRKIVFRTRDPFPSRGTGRVIAVRLAKLEELGFECIDLTKDQLATLVELQKLQQQTADGFPLFVSKRLFSLPAVEKLLGI